MKKIIQFAFACILLLGYTVSAQQTMPVGDSGLLPAPIVVPSIAQQLANGTLQLGDNTPKLGRAKGKQSPVVIPGKGSTGNDPLVATQRSQEASLVQTRAPITTFVADVSSATPSDPTGAAGPNHYVAAWNSAFRIFDKQGNPLTDELALGTLFPGNNIGDPIVFFDANVDNGPDEPRGRFVVTEFDSSPNGFNMAVSAGPDPVNDEWFVYTMGFETGAFPDYTKFAVWGDLYVVTANIGQENRVFAVERNQMLINEDAQFAAFPLPGIVTSGFYSPHGFHITGDETVPAGTPAPIVYLQDDAWGGVDKDHIKLWEITVDWADVASSSIELAQEIDTAEFVAVFDGGSFSNIPQGGGGPDVDALQATMVQQVQYRRFPTHNSVVMNFVVDVLDPGEKAGIRWYELRQTADNEEWTIHQEGTYVAPGKRSAFQGSMVMDSQGNIALGYISSSEENFVGMHYTGRFADDPLNVMTVYEQTVFQSTAICPTDRLADYTHLTLDPVDESFWYITEQFDPSRRDIVTNFTLDEAEPNDLTVFSIATPVGDAEYTDDEEVTVTIRNFGTNAITDPSIQYTVNGGAAVVETFVGTIEPTMSADFTFAQGADLSEPGVYLINVSTLLDGDSIPENDTLECVATNTLGLACMPSGNCAGFNDGVTVITLADQSELMTICGGSGYSDDTSVVFNFTSPESLTGVLQVGFDDSAFAFWVDINDDAIFSSDELIGSGLAPDANEDFEFTLDISALDLDQLTANPLTMRVRGEDESTGGDVEDPCDDLQFGRTNDYTAVFTSDVLSIEDNLFEGSALTITSTDNNHFSVDVVTPFQGRAAISVYNTLGQRLAYNNLTKEGNRFAYDLDMSYASAGVYIVQFTDIDGNSKLVEKIIVN